MSNRTREEVLAYVDDIVADDNNEKVMGMYNDWGPNYDKDMEHMKYLGPKFLADEVMTFLGARKDVKILDVGAGTGGVGQMLHDNGYKNLDCLDGSQSMLNVAKKRGVYKKLVCAYMGPNKLPIEDNTYDLVCGTGCFHVGHVRADCFAELIRVTKPGSRIIIVIGEPPMGPADYDTDWVPTCKKLETDGLWKLVKEAKLAHYLEDEDALVFHYEVL